MDDLVVNNGLDEAINALQEVEKLGESIVIDKELIIDFDRRRNKNREALRAIQKTNPDKIWLCFGNMFVKTQLDKAKDIIQRDQQHLDKSIDAMRDGIKEKYNDLNRLEGKEQNDSFNLKPINRKEVEALNSILPNVIL